MVPRPPRVAPHPRQLAPSERELERVPSEALRRPGARDALRELQWQGRRGGERGGGRRGGGAPSYCWGRPPAARPAGGMGAKIIILACPPGPAPTTPTIASCLTDTTPDPLLPPAL